MTDWAQQTRKELDERTAWALRLDKELAERTDWALRLDKELAERTAWALELNRELERLGWAQRLDRFAAKLYHIGPRLTGWLSRRFKGSLPARGGMPKK